MAWLKFVGNVSSPSIDNKYESKTKVKYGGVWYYLKGKRGNGVQ